MADTAGPVTAGVSTACLYPMEPEEALTRLCQAGVRHFELFLCTHSEYEPDYTDGLLRILDRYSARVCAVHPYLSGFEHCLFSPEYPRRQRDALAYYRRMFAAAERLGATRFSFHGDRKRDMFSDFDGFCRAVAALSETAGEYGVALCQENVSTHLSGDPDYIRRMRERIAPSLLHFTLDVKQAMRAGFSPYDMQEAMGRQLAHIHINDFSAAGGCVLPGKGDFALHNFVKQVCGRGYTGSLIVEVYSDCFTDCGEIAESLAYVNGLLPGL